jgi:hypothetical protein
MESDYFQVGKTVDLTRHLYQNVKFFITQKLSQYDTWAQLIDDRKSKQTGRTEYIRRGEAGDLILASIAIYTPKN